MGRSLPTGRRQRGLPLLVAVALIMTGCGGTGDTGDDSADPTTSTGELPPTTTTTSALPEDAHVVEGLWTFTYTLESVSENLFSIEPGDSDIRFVDIVPTCSVGPCELEMAFETPYLDDDPTPLTADWSGEAYVAVLELPGQGSCNLEDGTVFEEGLDLRTTIEFSPSDFVEGDPAPIASELAGKRVLTWSPTEEAATAGCEPSSQEFSVSAVLHDPQSFVTPSSAPPPEGTAVFNTGSDVEGAPPDGTTSNLAEDVPSQFAISPDGGTLAFVVGSGLWISAADGSDSRRLQSEARVANFSELAWSHDGSKVAFVRRATGGGADVWYAEVPYGVLQRVTDGGAALGGVTWGTGDQTILFDWGVNTSESGPGGSNRTYEIASSIYEYDLATEEITELVVNGFRPSLGSSGQVLSLLVPQLLDNGFPIVWQIYVADPDGTNFDLVLVAALTGCGPSSSTSGVAIPCTARVSPDDASLIFSDQGSCEGSGCGPASFDEVGVWKLDIASGEPTPIAPIGNHPQWTG